jgi:hypothetical protein
MRSASSAQLAALQRSTVAWRSDSTRMWRAWRDLEVSIPSGYDKIAIENGHL